MTVKYKLPWTTYGVFNTGFDGTYLAKFNDDVDTTSNLDFPQHRAGKYDKGYPGLYPRVRARVFLNWNLGDWSAGYRARYIGPFSVGSTDLRQGTSGDQGVSGVELHYAPYVVQSLNVGYKLPSTNSSRQTTSDPVPEQRPEREYRSVELRHDRPLLLRALHRQVLI
jgi:iron complex outermembrane receptor protein